MAHGSSFLIIVVIVSMNLGTNFSNPDNCNLIWLSARTCHVEFSAKGSSTTPDCISCWAVLVVAGAKGWNLHQMDVKSMFLQGDLEELVYMVQSPEFQSQMNKSVVCRLKQSLYRLKQAPSELRT